MTPGETWFEHVKNELNLPGGAVAPSQPGPAGQTCSAMHRGVVSGVTNTSVASLIVLTNIHHMVRYVIQLVAV